MFGVVFGVIVKLVTWWLNREKSRLEAKKQFLKFVDTLHRDQLVSTNLKKNDRDQIKELRKLRGDQ